MEIEIAPKKIAAKFVDVTPELIDKVLKFREKYTIRVVCEMTKLSSYTVIKICKEYGNEIGKRTTHKAYAEKAKVYNDNDW